MDRRKRIPQYSLKELFHLSLIINHVSFSYGEKEILHDISATFPEKGFVVLLGKSGSGKTTLLSLLSHTLPLKQGTITGNERESIAYVFQSPLLLDYLNVRENVLLFLKMNGKEVDGKKVDETLERLGILSLEKRDVVSLSGGEKMRVSLARALLLDTPILILDEPTGQLDGKTTEEINALLKELSKDRLLLMVTHDEKSADMLADSLYLLKDGKLIQKKGTEEKTKDERTKPQKGQGMHYQDILSLTLSFLRKKKIRILFSSLFLFLNLFFLYFGMRINQMSGMFLQALSEEYYDASTVKLQEKVTIAQEGHLSLKQYRIPEKEKAESYGFSTLYPSLSFFVPESKEIAFHGVEGTLSFAPVLRQSKEKLKVGREAKNKEIVVNDAFLSQYGLSEKEVLGKEISFHHSFLFYGSEIESREILSIPYSFTIVGISREKKLMNQPRAYYDYPQMVSYLSEIKLENLSVEWNRDVFISDLLDIDAFCNESFLSYSVYAEKESPMTSLADFEEDTFQITNAALTFYAALKEVIVSLSKIVLLFLSLDLVLAFLCSFLLMYSLFEDNLRFFALLTLSRNEKENRRKTLLTYSLLFSLFNGTLLFASVLLFSLLADGVLSLSSYPSLFHGISLPLYSLLFLLLLLISFFSAFLGLRKVKREEVKGQLEGEE